MGRIRSIKPEFPQSESIGRLTRDARLLFIQLWTLADDEGRTRGASRMIASLLYPYDADAPSLIETWLTELEAEHHIHRYVIEGAAYIEILKFNEHQKIDRPSKSKLPAFTITRDDSPKPREDSTTDQGWDQGKDQGGDGINPSETPRDECEVPEGMTAMQYARGVFEHCQIPMGGNYKIQVKMADALGYLAKEEDCPLHVATSRMMTRLRAAPKDVKTWFWLEDRKYLESGDVYTQFLSQGA